MGVTQALGKNKSHRSVYLNTGRGLLPEGLTTSLFRLLTQHTHTGSPKGTRGRPRWAQAPSPGARWGPDLRGAASLPAQRTLLPLFR